MWIVLDYQLLTLHFLIVGQFLATYFIRRYGLNYTSNFLHES